MALLLHSVFSKPQNGVTFVQASLLDCGLKMREQLLLLSHEQLVERCVELENQRDEAQLAHFQELEEMEAELTAAEVEVHREHAIAHSLEDRLARLREEQSNKIVDLEARNRALSNLVDELKEQVQNLQKTLGRYQDKVERLQSVNRSMASQLEVQSEKLEELEERHEMVRDDLDDAVTGMVEQMSELAQEEASAVLASKTLAKREVDLQHQLQAALRLQQQQKADRDEVSRATSEGLAELERKLASLESLRSSLKTDRDAVAKQRQKVREMLEKGLDVKEEREHLDRLRTHLETHTNAMVEIFEHRQRSRAHQFATIRASIRFAGLDRRRRSSMNLEEIRQVLSDLSREKSGTRTSHSSAPSLSLSLPVSPPEKSPETPTRSNKSPFSPDETPFAPSSCPPLHILSPTSSICSETPGFHRMFSDSSMNNNQSPRASLFSPRDPTRNSFSRPSTSSLCISSSCSSGVHHSDVSTNLLPPRRSLDFADSPRPSLSTLSHSPSSETTSFSTTSTGASSLAEVSSSSPLPSESTISTHSACIPTQTSSLAQTSSPIPTSCLSPLNYQALPFSVSSETHLSDSTITTAQAQIDTSSPSTLPPSTEPNTSTSVSQTSTVLCLESFEEPRIPSVVASLHEFSPLLGETLHASLSSTSTCSSIIRQNQPSLFSSPPSSLLPSPRSSQEIPLSTPKNCMASPTLSETSTQTFTPASQVSPFLASPALALSPSLVTNLQLTSPVPPLRNVSPVLPLLDLSNRPISRRSSLSLVPPPPPTPNPSAPRRNSLPWVLPPPPPRPERQNSHTQTAFEPSPPTAAFYPPDSSLTYSAATGTSSPLTPPTTTLLEDLRVRVVQ